MAPLIAGFICGLLLFNAIPHLTRGISGKAHMTPFSRRSGAWVNVVWAWVNIIAGLMIAHVFNVFCSSLDVWVAFGSGGFLISMFLAFFWSNPEARLPWHKRDIS